MINKPEKLDPDKYYTYYVEKHKGNNLLEALIEESNGLLKLLDSIEETKSSYRYQDDKWTIKQVLMHIVDTEQILANRALRFARFDQQELTGFNENSYAEKDNSVELSLRNILELFSATRNNTLTMFKYFNPESLDNKGMANKLELTPRILGWFILGHQIHHVQVLKERYL